MTTPVSNKHITVHEDPQSDQEYLVTMDEKTLLTYLFPPSCKNISSAFDCIEKLLSLEIPLSHRNLHKLGEMFGIDGDRQWQAFLNSITKEGVSPGDDRGYFKDVIQTAIDKHRKDVAFLKELIPDIGQIAKNTWEEDETNRNRKKQEEKEQAEKKKEQGRKEKEEIDKREDDRKEKERNEADLREKLRQEEEQRKLLEEVKRASEGAILEKKIQEEIQKKEKEEVKKKIAEEFAKAKLKAIKEEENARLEKQRAKFIEE